MLSDMHFTRTARLSTMSIPKLKILVSGAGIAGPCFAYWLTRSRLNTSITLVERSPSPRVTGQSLDIEGPAVEIVKKMNLEEAVRAKHTTEEGTRILNSAGKTVVQFDVGEVFTANYEILRADLAGLFLDATANSDNVRYMYGDSIKSLKQSEKAVDVSFTGGSQDTFDLVVAADGSTSRTRSMILSEDDLKDSYNFIGQYLAFFSIPRQSHDQKFWHIYNAPKGLSIMTRPHRSNTTMGTYLCITTTAHGKRDPAVEVAMDKGTEAAKRLLHKYFENTGWEAKRVLKGMDGAKDFYMTRAAQVKLPKWTNGRAACIGDAAFATFGVGTTLAIESAYLLAGELSKIQSSDDIPQALERYEKVFRPLYTKMEDLPPGFPQIAFPQTAWGIRLLQSVLWLISKLKVYKLFQGGSEMTWKLPTYDWRSAEGDSANP
jgi:2-polyprenyl-6-methoxyphenol hydroxylase-like FAD-dependent oxidoreductase